MRWSTPWLFLIGSRAAILDAATGWRAALVVGALLVLSAGFARNYDGEDLRAEPWWLLGPYAASVVTSLLLFGLYALIAGAKKQDLPARLYVPFLGLYWLTAPLAWLYAVPYEMFLSPVEAIVMNAYTLALVALWRVILMARVAQVLLGSSFWAAFFVDLWFGVVVIWLASWFGPRPVLDVMGGMRMSEVERVQSDIAGMTIFFGFFAAIVLAIPAFILMGKMRFPGLATLASGMGAARMESKARGRGSRWALIAAAACVVVWVPLLARQQPKVRIVREAETLMEEQRIDALLVFLSGLDLKDVPAGWTPPMAAASSMEEMEATGLDRLHAAIDRAQPPLPSWLRGAYVRATGTRLNRLAGWTRGRDWVERLENVDLEWTSPHSSVFNEVNVRHLRWMAKHADAVTDREREAILRVTKK